MEVLTCENHDCQDLVTVCCQPMSSANGTFISLNRAHQNISEGVGNLIFGVHIVLRVVSKASMFEAFGR